jgi:hypothetical protein
MSYLRVFWLIAAFVWVLPGNSFAAPPEIPAPRSYYTWTVTTGGGSGIVIGLIPYEIRGKIAVCGAIWPVNEKQQGMQTRDQVLRAAIVEIRGKAVPASLNVFRVYGSQDVAKTFACSVSKRPWQGPYKVDEFNLRFRTSKIYF